MAIGYRFASNEIAVMLKYIGIRDYQLIDIDVGGMTEEEEKNSIDNLCKKKVLIRNEEGLSCDKVIRFIIYSIAMADNYAVIAEDGTVKVIVVNKTSTIFMKKNMNNPDVWHLFPYETFLDFVLGDHGKINAVTEINMVSVDGAENLSWKEYSERMMNDE